MDFAELMGLGVSHRRIRRRGGRRRAWLITGGRNIPFTVRPSAFARATGRTRIKKTTKKKQGGISGLFDSPRNTLGLLGVLALAGLVIWGLLKPSNKKAYLDLIAAIRTTWPGVKMLPTAGMVQAQFLGQLIGIKAAAAKDLENMRLSREEFVEVRNAADIATAEVTGTGAGAAARTISREERGLPT